MAFARVQGTTGTTGATFPTSLATTAFGSTLGKGNAIIMAVIADGLPQSVYLKVTDTAGNQYVRIGTANINAVDQVDIWACWNTKAQASNIITVSGLPNTTAAIVAEEWSGLPLDFSFDVTIKATDNTGTSTAVNSGTSTSTNYLNEIVWNAVFFSSSTATATVGTGYSNLTTVTSSPSKIAVQSKTVSALGTQNALMTLSAGASWGSVLVTISDTARVAKTTSPFHPGKSPLSKRFNRLYRPRLDTTSATSSVVNTSVTQLSANLVLTGGTQVVAATKVGTVAQVSANLVLTGGTQSTDVGVQQTTANLVLTPGTQTVASAQIASVAQVAGTLTLTGGTQTVASVQIVSVAQTSANLVLTGGTQAVATTQIASVAQVSANLVLSGGTQVVASQVVASVAQVTANLVLTGGTQAVSTGSVVNGSVTQLSANLVLSGGTQVVASTQIVAIAQVSANLVLAGGTQAVASVQNASIAQTSANLVLSGGTQVVTSVRIASVTQVAANLLLTGGTQTVASQISANVAQVSANLVLSGGVQSVATVQSVFLNQVAAILTMNPGTQGVSGQNGVPSFKFYYDIRSGRPVTKEAGIVEGTIFRAIDGKAYEVINSSTGLVSRL